MSTAEQIRNTIIEDLMSINDTEHLKNLKRIIAEQSNDLVSVTAEQRKALLKSEEDIAAGRLYTNEEVEEDDNEWLV